MENLSNIYPVIYLISQFPQLQPVQWKLVDVRNGKGTLCIYQGVKSCSTSAQFKLITPNSKLIHYKKNNCSQISGKT